MTACSKCFFRVASRPFNGFQLALNIQLFPYHGLEFFIKPHHIHDVIGLQEIQHFRRVFEVIQRLGISRFPRLCLAWQYALDVVGKGGRARYSCFLLSTSLAVWRYAPLTAAASGSSLRFRDWGRRARYGCCLVLEKSNENFFFLYDDIFDASKIRQVMKKIKLILYLMITIEVVVYS